MLRRRLGVACVLCVLLLVGCATPPRPRVADDAQIPPFARIPYQPFSREAAVQIALREWRAFGSVIALPGQELPYDAERSQGLWQRVGEYWWLGLPMGTPEQGWTGMHDQHGIVFPASRDGDYAWSAAFISYVMRMAGAGHQFPYSASHSDYINAAKEHATGRRPNLAITAERPESYAARTGDLICMWRGRRPVRFDDLPAGHFPGHCDIVVATRPGTIDAIGGNVENTVALWHVPATLDGRIARPDGTALDPDHPWFVVIRVDYTLNPAPTVPVS